MVASHIDSCPGDLQAGRQGKEGLVSSTFLIQWTLVLYFLSLFHSLRYLAVESASCTSVILEQ